MGRIKYKNQPCAYWAERLKINSSNLLKIYVNHSLHKFIFYSTLLLTIGYAVSLQIKTNSFQIFLDLLFQLF